MGGRTLSFSASHFKVSYLPEADQDHFTLHAFLQVRHGAGTGLREILKSHGAGGGKLVGSAAEQVRPFAVDLFKGCR